MSGVFSCIENLDMKSFKIETIKEGVMVKDLYGDTPLHACVLKKDLEFVEEIMEYNPDLNAQNHKGQTALHYAAELNLVRIASLLLRCGGDPNIQDKYGNNPLWSAIFYDKGFGNNLELIKLLLDFNSDKNHKNLAGLSPLDFAKKANYPEVVSLLEN
ncbi:MAG TPA: ankyrin repeat domain-containing protein [Puia sp.]|nr:ankyrin repeat domain-containing protein [Puia sp.]